MPRVGADRFYGEQDYEEEEEMDRQDEDILAAAGLDLDTSPRGFKQFEAKGLEAINCLKRTRTGVHKLEHQLKSIPPEPHSEEAQERMLQILPKVNGYLSLMQMLLTHVEQFAGEEEGDPPYVNFVTGSNASEQVNLILTVTYNLNVAITTLVQLIKSMAARHCSRAAQRKRASNADFYYQIGKLFDDTADSAQEAHLEVLDLIRSMRAVCPEEEKPKKPKPKPKKEKEAKKKPRKKAAGDTEQSEGHFDENDEDAEQERKDTTGEGNEDGDDDTPSAADEPTLTQKVLAGGGVIIQETEKKAGSVRAAGRGRPKNDTVKAFICIDCNKVFSKARVMAEHRRVHTQERPYACDQCDKRFKRTDHLTNHKRIHTNHKKYQCQVCGQAFTHSGTLYRHKLIHSDNRSYECRKCQSMMFSSPSTRAVHERKCSGLNSHAITQVTVSSGQLETTPGFPANLRVVMQQASGAGQQSSGSSQQQQFVHPATVQHAHQQRRAHGASMVHVSGNKAGPISAAHQQQLAKQQASNSSLIPGLVPAYQYTQQGLQGTTTASSQGGATTTTYVVTSQQDNPLTFMGANVPFYTQQALQQPEFLPPHW